MRDEGHIAPAAAPAVFVPPHTHLYPLCLFVPPTLVCTHPQSPHAVFVPPCICQPLPLPSFAHPCSRVHCPALAPAPPCSHLLPRGCIHCPVPVFVVLHPCLLPYTRVCCSALAFIASVL